MGEIGKLKKAFLFAILSLYKFPTALCSFNSTGVVGKRKEVITMTRIARDGKVRVSTEIGIVGTEPSKLNLSFAEKIYDFSAIEKILTNFTNNEIDLKKDWKMVVDYRKGNTQRPISAPNNQLQVQPLADDKMVKPVIWPLDSGVSSYFSEEPKDNLTTPKENPIVLEENDFVSVSINQDDFNHEFAEKEEEIMPEENDFVSVGINQGDLKHECAKKEEAIVPEENDYVLVSINQGDLKFECDEKEKAMEILNIVKAFKIKELRIYTFEVDDDN